MNAAADEEGKARGDSASVDRPIVGRADDKLRRRTFAETIARQMLADTSMDSSVVAIIGPWGSGKTSVLNMIEEVIAAEEGDTVVTLHFNPWLFSTSEELASRFFAELAAELRSKKEQALGTVADRLGDYAERLRPIASIPIVSDLPVIGGVLKGTQSVAEGAANLASRLDRFGDESVRSQRNAIERALRETDKRFVIVVDDIDRLGDGEVREIVRLIRLVADFPRTTYVLAFDRRRVEEVLGDGDSQRGRDYLEKIVQEAHDLPPARAEDLSRLFSESVDAAIDGLETGPFDADYWGNVFHFAVRPLISTPRDAARVARALPAAVRALGSEVHLVDVIALETFRVLAPDIYAALPDVADLLTYTDTGFVGYGNRDDREGGAKRLQVLFDVDEENQAAARELFKWVFPGSRAFIENTHYGADHLGGWRRSRRVAHPDVCG